jgi:hypothetical protein
LDENGALMTDEADEIEDEREDRLELSETIDSGDDMDDTEFASEERRARRKPWGDTFACHLSVDCAAETDEMCDIAKPIDGRLSMQDAALTAGVLYPVLCGVSFGVGRRPSAGASLFAE